MNEKQWAVAYTNSASTDQLCVGFHLILIVTVITDKEVRDVHKENLDGSSSASFTEEIYAQSDI